MRTLELRGEGLVGLTRNCTVCTRVVRAVNNQFSECSHLDCPHRRRAWSDRPRKTDYFKGPWPRNTDADPVPLDEELKR